MGGERKDEEKGNYSTLSGEVQNHYKVATRTLESIKKHAIGTYWVMENIRPRIHNQGKMAACFTSRPMYQPEKETPVPVDWTPVWPGLNNQTNLSPLLGIERQFLCRPSHSLVTIMMSYIPYREFN